MAFWNWYRKHKREETYDNPENPYILFELVDGVHLEIDIGWPIDGDIEPFAHLLALINSGHVIDPQITEATLHAERVKQPEKAVAIHAAISTAIPSKKKDEVFIDKPLISPSKVISNQIKNSSH